MTCAPMDVCSKPFHCNLSGWATANSCDSELVTCEDNTCGCSGGGGDVPEPEQVACGDTDPCTDDTKYCNAGTYCAVFKPLG